MKKKKLLKFQVVLLTLKTKSCHLIKIVRHKMNKYKVIIDAYMQRKRKRDIWTETQKDKDKYTETEAWRERQTQRTRDIQTETLRLRH